MKIKKAFILLLDISGYTQFIKLHKISLIHAEKIISELFESVIDSTSSPLVLNKLEGDAALFYAISENEEEMSKEIKRQLQEIFLAFNKKEEQLISACQLCICEACQKVKELKLKAVLHYGEILIKKIRDFEEIAGGEVILAHRFLKNSIKEKEYILMSEPFYKLSGGIQGLEINKSSESYDGEDVGIVYSFPGGTSHMPEKMNFWEKIKLYAKLEKHLVKRIFKKIKNNSFF